MGRSFGSFAFGSFAFRSV